MSEHVLKTLPWKGSSCGSTSMIDFLAAFVTLGNIVKVFDCYASAQRDEACVIYELCTGGAVVSLMKDYKSGVPERMAARASDRVLAVIERSGYAAPFPIQAQALPAIMNGRDVIAIAKTGSGKTMGCAPSSYGNHLPSMATTNVATTFLMWQPHS